VGFKRFSRFFFGNAKVVSPIEYGVVTAVLSTATVTGLLAVGHAHVMGTQTPLAVADGPTVMAEAPAAVTRAPVIEIVQIADERGR
jgi:hypothetical protein